MDRHHLRESYHQGVRLAVLGDPIAHSLSPVMHNAALKALKLPYRYDPIHVTASELSEVFSSLRDLGFFGWNLTLPHKVTALSLVDGIDAVAERLGAINTIVNRSGRLFGYNTDGPGLVAALEESFGIEWFHSSVAILGAGGGAGQAAARYLATKGINRLAITNRTRSKIESLQEELGNQIETVVFDWEQLDRLFRENDLIINATSIGLDGSELDWPKEWLRSEHRIYDMVYGKKPSPLVQWARGSGITACDGLSMLLHQGALGFERWFGKPAPIDAMRQALTPVISQIQNPSPAGRGGAG